MSDESTPPLSPPVDPAEEALARFLDGACEPAEAQAVEAWLAAHPVDAALVAMLRDREAAMARRADAAPVDTEAALAAVRKRMDAVPLTVVRGAGATRAASGKEPRFAWSARSVGFAAAAGLLIAIGLLQQRSAGSAARGALAYQTKVGLQDSVRLADGTLAVLAPGSSLQVAADFGASSRELRLTGAAYFEVVHDEARPFTVRTGDVVIRDIGTVFSVHTAANGRVSVAVTHGSVGMRVASSAEETLSAGDRAVTDAGQLAIRRGVVTTEDMAWTRGVLAYRDTPLADVRADLQRWYGLDLRVADDALLGRTLTASFRGQSAREVIRLIALALGAEAVQRGDTVFLQPMEAGRPPQP